MPTQSTSNAQEKPETDQRKQLLAERLQAAIDHLSPHQEARLQAIMEERGIKGGIKAGIAMVAGLPTPSVLSDILAGRTSGQRHLEGLASTLGVSIAWLNGDDRSAPLWSLSPLAAFRAWSEQLAHALSRRHSRNQRSASDAGVIERGPSPNTTLEVELAIMLQLRQGDANLAAIAAGRWSHVDLEILLRLATYLTLEEPTHPEHLRMGQAMAKEVDVEIEAALKQLRRRYERFLLPTRLFQLVRLALVGLKATRSWEGRSPAVVDDCLEILWRQQLVRRGASRRAVPNAFVRETGRSGWTPLAELQRRHPDDGIDMEAPYDSQRNVSNR
jgi:transcriptional regulator with XRE-family HTH domain